MAQANGTGAAGEEGEGNPVSRVYTSGADAKRGNAGLRLDKYLDVSDPAWGDVAGRRLDDPAYRLAYQRWESYWMGDAPARVCVKGRVKGRLAVGLGAKGVLEVGLRLQQVYGTPVIPASAVKGVLRGRLKDKALIAFLFGSEESAGFVRFQDAWWAPDDKSPLAMDVVTPHHQKYYAKQGPPSDCDNPVPVPFLSVRGTFLFVAELVADAPSPEWKGYVERLLKETLERRGIGGKTAAGYGRFVYGG